MHILRKIQTFPALEVTSDGDALVELGNGCKIPAWVLECESKLSGYMRQRQIGHWELGHTQSRFTSSGVDDANLIAAAPDLLDALLEMTALASGPVGGVSQEQKVNILKKARAAIDAATKVL